VPVRNATEAADAREFGHAEVELVARDALRGAWGVDLDAPAGMAWSRRPGASSGTGQEPNGTSANLPHATTTAIAR
jgi:hypothetical protein